MPTVTYTQPNGTQQTLQVEEGTTLMRAAVSNGIDGIIGECGGQAMCATCHVYVRPEYARRCPRSATTKTKCSTAPPPSGWTAPGWLPDQNRRRTRQRLSSTSLPANSRSGDNDMSVVIIGGGQAGLQVADTLRTEGYEGKIHVIAEESGLPYQRPPLSKDYLAPGKEPAPLPLRGASFFEDKNVTLHEGVQALAIDRAERKVQAHRRFTRLRPPRLRDRRPKQDAELPGRVPVRHPWTENPDRCRSAAHGAAHRPQYRHHRCRIHRTGIRRRRPGPRMRRDRAGIRASPDGTCTDPRHG